MRSADIRKTFLSYFEGRDHRVVPSSPLIPTDPTVLFTIAGMVQFKPYFLGEQPPPFPRATSVQKCFRTENIEDVGNNARDCTLFEMLGNFSFGDYFKHEACPWAWTLLTEGFGIDPDRIWISVYEDEKDHDTARVWRDEVGVPADRVLPFPKEDNFWHMGVAGPCGPCTELYVDRGPQYGPEGKPSRADEPKNHRYQEIYNLVFMEFVQDAPFHVVGELDQKGVDTGMGVERLSQILQDVPTVFDTDLYTPMIERIGEITGLRRDAGDDQRRVVEILADHSRAITFLIADGVAPSNEGRGYVLRRVLRRALTKARRIGVDNEILAPLCDVVVDHFADAYPELARNREGVLAMVAREEQSFSRTLDAGMHVLQGELSKDSGRISGGVAFQLHDTYGFPVEMTREVAADVDVELDEAEFERLMEQQRARSRSDTEAGKAAAEQLRIEAPATRFLGYDALEAESTVVAIVDGTNGVPAAGEGTQVRVVLDRSPFYAEGGGQIGDRGWLVWDGGRAEITDTKPHGALHLHTATVMSGELRVGTSVQATVAPAHRSAVEPAHTATHMMHHALRELLGTHVRQMGSVVQPGRLRFDFSHYAQVDRELLDQVEEVVNERVAADDGVRWFETDYRRAVDELGAIAFFEEKYGDLVRVVEVGDYSRELCGGTHVPSTGAVGLVKVVSEGSIASNVRRVECLTGTEGLRYVNRRLAMLDRAADLLSVPSEEIVEGIERHQRAAKDLQKQIDAQKAQRAGDAVDDIVGAARQIGRGKLVVHRLDEDVDTVRKLAILIRDKLDDGVVVLGRGAGKSANLVAGVGRSLTGSGVDAREVLADAAAAIGGRAGGKPDLAMGGGGNPDGLEAALAAATRAAEEKLRA